jgi:hypothetical protein
MKRSRVTFARIEAAGDRRARRVAVDDRALLVAEVRAPGSRR